MTFYSVALVRSGRPVLSTRLPARAAHKLQARAFSASSTRGKERLVILGSGWGGYEVLRGVDRKRWDVTMISASSYFNFTPLLASCAVGTLEFRCAVEPVRRYAPEATTYNAWCDKIDFKQKTLTCVPATPLPSYFERPQQTPTSVSEVSTTPPKLRLATQAQTIAVKPRKEFTILYDKLVIAVGCYAQTFGVPGVKEYGYFLKDVRDARAIRSRVLECFEEASQPTLSDIDRRNLLNFCIVGAGPTGVEFAAELHDLLKSDIRKYYGEKLTRLARINLYDVADRMLGGFEEGLAKYAERKFARDGINIRLRHHVERVEDGVLHVKEQGEVPFGMLVWSTGLAPNPLIQSIAEIEKDGKTGSLLTDNHLRVIKKDGSISENIWAIGDCAIIQDELLPATAQVASQKAKYVTRVLNRLVRDRPTEEPFQFRNRGSLAYLGDWKALYDRSKVETGPKGSETGRLAWLLWRSAYFTQTLSIRNKITVPYYWFLNWIFGRDITRL
ncbi:FAD/NAD-binding domain-containing protein [Fomitiporia mediterranea MF3/22]|uniref:FAD/NAD-binding domain-containing protein n=1 Tax=Fomitiporia mediterranea (strain MF3/22) TaxID=694068 RepID=UPI0004409019|nr:FAD/NAD-binding domain-containing protein [Fomitiporia mediterranea MF3/22]EJD00157.1 FAD/NAD-binding domain-containing protein [Fomitiporia mediterranea MF3/22]